VTLNPELGSENLTGSMAAMNGSIRNLTIVKMEFSTDFCHESMSRVVSMTFASGK
jgi:hypothetical protein